MNSGSDRFVIYEVNLEVQAGAVSQFEVWLLEHIKEMLAFDGFVSASWFELLETSSVTMDSELCQFCVRYHVENEGFLAEYFTRHAESMRQKGVAQFRGNFSATRRIMREKLSL